LYAIVNDEYRQHEQKIMHKFSHQIAQEVLLQLFPTTGHRLDFLVVALLAFIVSHAHSKLLSCQI